MLVHVEIPQASMSIDLRYFYPNYTWKLQKKNDYGLARRGQFHTMDGIHKKQCMYDEEITG